MGKTFLGLLLLVIGILFLLTNTGVIEMNLSTIISTYWPLLIILWGAKETLAGFLKFLSGLRKRRWRLNHLFWGLVLLITGLIIQANKLEYITVSWSDVWSWVWPIFIIYIGLSFILKKSREMSIHIDGEDKEFKSPKGVKRRQLVGDINLGRQSWQLEDIQLWMGVGDTDLDLTKAILPEGETVVDLSGWVGDITVLVPQDIAVKANVDVRIGEATLFSHQQAGSARFLSYTSEDYEGARKKVNIRISLSIGSVMVKWVH